MSQSVWITGASSGIGRALALELAGRGYALALSARRQDALAQLAQEIRSRHPSAVALPLALDVTDPAAVAEALAAAVESLDGLDIVIANAGVGLGGKIGVHDFDNVRRTVETNILGAMATVDAAVRYFRQRGGRGHVVATSSVAAFRGLPGQAAYCASKAAVATYMDALRAELYSTDIAVTTIYPGFIDTPINDMLANRPFLISAEKGAHLIADRIQRRAPKAIVPAWPWAWLRPLMGLIPTRLLAGRGLR